MRGPKGAAKVNRPVVKVPTHGRRLRKIVALVVAGGSLAFAIVLSLSVGAYPLSLGQVVRALFEGGETIPAIIVRQIRAPRTELAVMVGASLATSGALLQGFTGNPLADPGLLGINAGASLAIVLVTYVSGVVSLSGLVWYSLLGAGLATATVEIMSRTRGPRNVLTLVLSGAVMAALLSSAISVLLVLGSQNLQNFLLFETGSLAGRVPGTFEHTAPFAAAGLLIGLTRGPALNAIGLGDEVARSLGVRINRQELLIILAVALMAGSAVAAAGPIGFLGLAVPYLARAAVGPDHRWVLPISALGGASLLLYADTLARVIVPGGLEVGIVTAVIGAPILIIAIRTTHFGRS